MRLSPLLLLSLFTWIGCADHGVQPGAASGYYALWVSLGIHDYAVDQSRDCFCAEERGPVRLTVRSGHILSVMRLSDSALVPLADASLFRTIDSLFSVIRTTQDSIVVSYNPDYGYPEVLTINPQQIPVDGGIVYRTSDLRVP